MRSTNIAIKKTSYMVKLYLLPPFIKIILALGLFIFICVIGITILHRQSVAELVSLKQRKVMLEKEVTREAKSYGDLVYLSKNAKEAKEQYQSLIKQFPPEFKIGELLADISKLGTEQGLKFIYFKPQQSVDHVYYAEVPVEISVVGQFHQIGRFLGGVANLPGSVVAVNHFTLTRLDGTENLLSLQFTATLYHTLPTSLDIKA
ncbi:MAG: hypothetical protein A3F13_04560 [Gammaproteobacteria bacterium RIFCSPHIGHO2_12_FULL_40_19]|nr:MAG: hypothetical protein A3F13_04560 [Gammaproteobacteria bacterium RIFCSPHIGHO2_12_FULL_40_19]